MDYNNKELVEVAYQPYIKKNYFFSLAEVKFYDLLKEILGDKYLLFSKVRISDLIMPKYDKDKYLYFNKIKAKHIDFLICDKNPVKPKAIIELDDNSHNNPARQERDQFIDEAFANAGIPIAHIKVRSEYNKEEIIEQIQKAYRTKFVIKQKEDHNPPLEWWRGCLEIIPIVLIITYIIFENHFL